MARWKQISSLVHNKTLISALQRTSYTFTPNKEEVIESRFRLRYSNTCNSYYRDWFDAIDPSSKGVITGWEKALFSVDSVRRHINEDIGQVYLERVPGSNTGCIKWRMDFGCCGLLVDEVTIRLSCVEDYGGEIMVTMMGEPNRQRVRYAVGSDYVTYTELQNSPELTLIVHFVGEADQVTQLFPQNILRGMEYPLDIQVILKPPLQSLGRPRILVGLLYSSSQETEVDSRHYKQNTSNQSSQGFLHIHLLRGRDLPGVKQGSLETFSKCYLLPDAKKTTKCRTKTRKGKDPYWNEQFLVVGINYHEIKRRALEICIADSHTSVGKKAKFVGGVRLSLGYKAVISAQTKQVNQVLRFLKGKGGMSGEMTRSKDETEEGRDLSRKVSFSKKDTVIGSVNSSALRWKQASWTRVANEKSMNTKINEELGEEVTYKTYKKENGDTADEGKEEGEKLVINDENDRKKAAADATKTNEAGKGSQRESFSSSTGELTTVWYSAPDLVVGLEKDLGTNFATRDDGSKIIAPAERGKTEISSSHTAVQNTTEISGSDESKTQALVHQRLFQSLMTSIKELEFVPNHGGEDQPPIHQEKESEQEKNKGDPTDNGIVLNVLTKDNDITKVESGNANQSPNSSEHSRREDDHQSNKQNSGETCIKTEASNQNESTTEDLLLKAAIKKKLEALERKQNLNDAEGLESESTAVHEETRKPSTGLNEMKRSSSFTLKDFGKKLNFRRRSKSSEEEETGSDTNLDTKVNKVMLDAQGLEITQWNLMVERPKEWHYCWHILRSEMTILH